MATYQLPPPGSSVNAKGGDAMPTLYLMNPSYSDASGGTNMVFLAAAAARQQQQQHNHTQQQQQQSYGGFCSLPPQPPPHHHITAMVAAAGGGSPPTEAYGGGDSHSYGWSMNGVGNEFLFIPSTSSEIMRQEAGEELNPLAAPGRMRNHHHHSFQDNIPSFFPNGIAGPAPAEASNGSGGQILSLSLSPQPASLLAQLPSFPMQQLELGMNSVHGFSGHMGYATATKGEKLLWPPPPMPPTSALLHDHDSSAAAARQFQPRMDIIYHSKYLKPAQELLCEVARIRTETKPKLPTMASSGGRSGAAADASARCTEFLEKQAAESSGVTLSRWMEEAGNVGGGAGFGQHAADSNSGAATSVRQQGMAEQQQELQIRRARLGSMLEEVEERYRQYRHQMRVVVASFEAAAGAGAAGVYTLQALQTVSRHFRSIKDAVRGQLTAACRALGEEEVEAGGVGVGRLRFVNQQTRQQRALQQLGLLQNPQHQHHHPWRPQRGLPERSVSVLRAWLFEHFLHPYPKDCDKVLLARQTGLTRNQVSNWFINARVRLWKPMVEEMYAEEMREEAEEEGGVADIAKPPPAGGMAASEVKPTVGMQQSGIASGFSCHGGGKKSRGDEGVAAPFLVAPELGYGGGSCYKSEDEEVMEAARLRGSDGDGSRDYYGMMTREGGGGGGGCDMFRLNRYNEATTAASYNGGVSLTLGLQNGAGAAAQPFLAQVRGGGGRMGYYGMAEEEMEGGDNGRWRHLSGFSPPVEAAPPQPPP